MGFELGASTFSRIAGEPQVAATAPPPTRCATPSMVVAAASIHQIRLRTTITVLFTVEPQIRKEFG